MENDPRVSSSALWTLMVPVFGTAQKIAAGFMRKLGRRQIGFLNFT